MTWRFPRKNPVAGEIVNARDLNDAFLPFVEADGHLSEGNFDDAMATQLAQHTDIREDITLRTDATRVASYAGGPTSAASNEYQIPVGPGWTVITPLTRTLTVDVGPVIVMASFQAGRLEPGDGTTTTADRFYMHMQFGVRVDGNLVPYSVVGDQDSSTEGEFMELGIWNYLQGVDIFLVLPVAPGTHTIDVVAHAEGDIHSLSTAKEAILVYSRELTVVEVS